MDKKEFSKFAMALKTYYPRENLLPNQQAMELWYMELQDIPYNIASATLRQYVNTSKWSPTIADIREFATRVRLGETPDWGEGWKAVQNAIRHYGIYRIPEALASLDDLTRQVVQRLGFQELCVSENVVADRARFKDIYEQLADRKKKETQLPASLRLSIQEIRGSEQLGKNEDRIGIGVESKHGTEGAKF